MVFLIQEVFQFFVSFLCIVYDTNVLSAFNFSSEHHDHQESDDKHVLMVNLKNPRKNTVHRITHNQGKQNHTKWIERE